MSRALSKVKLEENSNEFKKGRRKKKELLGSKKKGLARVGNVNYSTRHLEMHDGHKIRELKCQAQ